MRPKYGNKSYQAKQGRELNPSDSLFSVVRQPAPKVGGKNAAYLEQGHENANVSSRELLGLQI
jgi:hypothetical protein